MGQRKQSGFIYIVNWKRFQHYSDRDPKWIKVYRDLLRKDEYLDLTLADRGLLHGLWLLASEFGDGRVSASRTFLGRRLNVRRVSLDPLIHAGFIKVRASKALAEPYQSATPEVSSKEETKSAASARRKSRRGAAPDNPNGHATIDEDVDWVYPPELADKMKREA